jgi:predicted dehydrogenase
MSQQEQKNERCLSRRRFLSRSSLAVAGATAALQFPHVSMAGPAGGRDEIKIGLIGCGGRGQGALLQAIGAATKVMYPSTGYHTEDVAEGATQEKTDIKVVALADVFDDRLTRCVSQLSKLGINIPKTRCFTGFNGYQELLAVPEVNYVIVATPPHFHPIHLKAAVEAGKHAFMEKPAGVDVPGIKMVMEAGQIAEQKGLGIAAGTQRRHAPSYQETIKRIRDGAIGDIIYGRCYWNGNEIWVIDRQPGWSDMEWQLRNWNYFTWLSGDHYVEQHVHNIDVINWVLGAHPVRAVSGVGGRQVRTDKRYGNIFDHFAVEFEYPGGIRMFSQARQINGCKDLIGEAVVGTKGTSNCENLIHPNGGKKWHYRGASPNPWCQEHEDLIASIRAGKPINDAQAVAESTMTGILGREAVYSGQGIEWDEAMKSTKHLGPATYELGAYPVPEVAMPGQYQFM